MSMVKITFSHDSFVVLKCKNINVVTCKALWKYITTEQPSEYNPQGPFLHSCKRVWHISTCANCFPILIFMTLSIK